MVNRREGGHVGHTPPYELIPVCFGDKRKITSDSSRIGRLFSSQGNTWLGQILFYFVIALLITPSSGVTTRLDIFLYWKEVRHEGRYLFHGLRSDSYSYFL